MKIKQVVGALCLLTANQTVQLDGQLNRSPPGQDP